MPKRRADEVEDDEEELSQGSDDSKSNQSGSDDSSSSDSDSEPEVSDDEEDSAGEEDEEYKEINVDFEFFDPSEKDFLGLKALLLTYLDGRQFDCSGLVDTIIQQVRVMGALS
jgi:protein BCP1